MGSTKAIRGTCVSCGKLRSLPAKSKCDKCYRAEYYEAHPEAKAQRDARQRERNAKMYEEKKEEIKARSRAYYQRTKGRKPRQKREVVGKKDVEKAVDSVYNQSVKVCALCLRKAGRGEVMLWGEELLVVHRVCGWAREARDNIERRAHEESLRSLQLEPDHPEQDEGDVSEPLPDMRTDLS